MRPLLLAALVVSSASSLAAQSLWPRPLSGGTELDLEWVRPTFVNETGLTATRGIWVLSGRHQLGPRGRVVVAVPFLRTGNSTSPYGEASTMGDPYLGYESTDSTGRSTLVVGVRLPWAATDASFPEQIAFVGDYDRFEESFPKTLTLHFEGQSEVWRDAEGADVRIRAGATLLHSTSSSTPSYDANTFLFDYGVRFGRQVGPVDLSLGLTGRMYLSGSGGNIAERTTHQGTVELSGRGRIAPRIAFRFPIDEPLKSVLDRAITIGVRATIQ